MPSRDAYALCAPRVTPKALSGVVDPEFQQNVSSLIAIATTPPPFTVGTPGISPEKGASTQEGAQLPNMGEVNFRYGNYLAHWFIVFLGDLSAFFLGSEALKTDTATTTQNGITDIFCCLTFSFVVAIIS